MTILESEATLKPFNKDDSKAAITRKNKVHQDGVDKGYRMALEDSRPFVAITFILGVAAGLVLALSF